MFYAFVCILRYEINMVVVVVVVMMMMNAEHDHFDPYP